MTVRELIKMLEELPPRATVLIGSQPSYPFENELAGVVQRTDFMHREDEDWVDEDVEPTDVLLLEGDQLRYGNSDAWECI
jgi:hypothetical protein